MQKKSFPYEIIIIGGLGHVGLPLGIVFAKEGLKTCLFDIDAKKADMVREGVMPFMEYDAEPILKQVIKNGNLVVSLDPKIVSKGKYIIVTIGTPVDEYLTPKTRTFFELFLKLKRYMGEDQIIIVRSTVYPHTCQQLLKTLGNDKKWRIAYCPERIVQGHAIKELKKLPQIVAGMDEQTIKEASSLFRIISPKIIKTTVGEAELIKLFTNSWRYIQFAVTNQFYMIARNFGVNYSNVRKAMVEGYERMGAMPTAGFAAGPCLLKDTMQLAAFSSNSFILGHAAMMVNEGLPDFLVNKLREKHDIQNKKIGILGMAFKADIDDIRDSLSYKLGKILMFHGADVFYSDEYVRNQKFITKEKLLNICDVIIIGAPHSAYKGLSIPKKKEVIDLWGIVKKK